MKKLFVFFVMCLVSFQAYCQSPGGQMPVSLKVEKSFNPVIGGNPAPKLPIPIPEVALDDHTLYLYDVDYDLTLVLMDEDDQISYTVFIPANTTSVVLPSWLEGDYLLLLIPDEDYYYVGDISL